MLNMLGSILCIIGLRVSLGLATSITPGYKVRNFPGTSVENTYYAVRRALSGATIEKRETVLKNSTTLDTSWEDTTLLRL
jgi:hypothetical protein